MIRFENVGMRYGSGPEVLHDVTFSLPVGSFHFLTGPSGAGKSSLLKLLYMAHRPSRGLITLLGKDISRLDRDGLAALRRKIGVVFQDFRLLEHLSAFDNVALPLRLAAQPESSIRSEVTDLLRWVGLGDHLDARPSTLSGGQKQRVAIARAIIGRPRFIMADEPTGSVDDQVGLRLLRLFEELNKLGTTVLIATHNEAMIRKFGYPRLHIESGHLTQEIPAGASEAAC
ncbi:MAG: cell division ATP-binding protein FtsE [Pseudomonadota bacterium]|nr:cell division ATP-binding protein FtsE [Pseudomonadota bacterium]